MVAGAAVQKFMMKLQDEQEILMNIADMGIEVYVAESTLLRTEKLIGIKGEPACELQRDLAMCYLHEAVEKVNNAGRYAITSFAEGDQQRVMLMGLKRFTKIEPMNLKNARRNIAEAMIAENKYIF